MTVAVGIVLALFTVVAVARNEVRRRRVATVVVDVGAYGVRRRLSDGREEAIRWDEVRVVEVMVATRGPHRATGGVVVLGGDDDRGCLIPLDSTASSGLVERLSAFPGMDVKALTEALSGAVGPTGDGDGGTRRQQFVRVWERRAP